MNLIVVTAPTVEPVTRDEARTYLRISMDEFDVHPHDAMIDRHIASARGDVERITKRALVEQTLRMYAPNFPYGTWQNQWISGFVSDYDISRGFGGQQRSLRAGAIELLRPPLVSVLSVKYYDTANVLQTVSSSDYYVTDDLVPQLRFIDGYSPPSVYDRPDAVQVNYVAGYPAVDSPPTNFTDNIPAELKNAILIGVELLYSALKPEEYAMLKSAQDDLLAGFTIVTYQ